MGKDLGKDKGRAKKFWELFLKITIRKGKVLKII